VGHAYGGRRGGGGLAGPGGSSRALRGDLQRFTNSPTAEDASRELACIERRFAGHWLLAGSDGTVFHEFLRELCDEYLFVVLVASEPQRRRVLEYSYVGEEGGGRATDSAKTRRPTGFPSGIARRLGWTTTPFGYQLPGHVLTRTYRFELHAPSGLECAGTAAVTAAPGKPRVHGVITATAAHLVISDATPGTEVEVVISLHAQLLGSLRARWSPQPSPP
jgi:hypothetical protein